MSQAYRGNGYSDFSVSALLKEKPIQLNSTKSEGDNGACESKNRSWFDGFRQGTDSKTRVSVHCPLSTKAPRAMQMKSLVAPQEPVRINSIPVIQLPGTHLASSVVWPPCSWIWLASQTNSTYPNESGPHFSSDDCLSPINYTDSRYISRNTDQNLTLTSMLSHSVQTHNLHTDTNRNTPLQLPSSTDFTDFPPSKTGRSVDPLLGHYSTFDWIDNSLTNAHLFDSSSKSKEVRDGLSFARDDLNTLHQRLLRRKLASQLEATVTPTQPIWLTQPATEFLTKSGDNLTNGINLLPNQLQSNPNSLCTTTKLPGAHFNTYTVSRRRGGILRRAVFNESQREGLETAFDQHAYITKPDRRILAEKLGLKDSQVKIWFQNRRMKWRSHGQHSRNKSAQSMGSKLIHVHEPLHGKVNGLSGVSGTDFISEKEHTPIEKQTKTSYVMASLDSKQDDFPYDITGILECPADTPMKARNSSKMAQLVRCPDVVQTKFQKVDSDFSKSFLMSSVNSKVS